MIKNFYTGNKKRKYFFCIKSNEYKIILFHNSDGTGQWISDWSEY